MHQNDVEAAFLCYFSKYLFECMSVDYVDGSGIMTGNLKNSFVIYSSDKILTILTMLRCSKINRSLFSLLFVNFCSRNFFSGEGSYTQYPIIRNCLIRNSVEILGKYKKQALGRSNLRNASKNLGNGQCSDFQS